MMRFNICAPAGEHQSVQPAGEICEIVVFCKGWNNHWHRACTIGDGADISLSRSMLCHGMAGEKNLAGRYAYKRFRSVIDHG